MNGMLVVKFVEVPFPEIRVLFFGAAMVFPVVLDRVADSNTTVASYPRDERVNGATLRDEFGC
jgi:hypothetical protein